MLKGKIKKDYVEVWDSLRKMYVVSFYNNTAETVDTHYYADESTAEKAVEMVKLGQYALKNNKVIVETDA
jgi:hypothetical protein